MSKSPGEDEGFSKAWEGWKVPPRDTTCVSSETPNFDPIISTQRAIADKLRKNSWIKVHGVKVIEQNSQEMVFLIKNEMGPLGGIALVVGIDKVTNNYPLLEVTVTITVTEYVTMNRQMQGYVTALEVSQAVVQMLDGFQWHFDSFQHKEDYQKDKFVCTALYRGLVEREILKPKELGNTP